MYNKFETEVIWKLHKFVKNKCLVSLAVKFQKYYFSKVLDLYKVYSYHVECMGAEATKRFIIDNRTLIVNLYNRQVVREFILNYRSRFQTDQTEKIYRMFLRHIINKRVSHSSDVAIACNILRCCDLTLMQQTIIVDFLVSRMYDHIPKSLIQSKSFHDPKFFLLKKGIVLSKVDSIKGFTQGFSPARKTP